MPAWAQTIVVPRMPPDHLHEGVEMRRPRSFARQDHVHVVVHQGQEPDLPGELEDPVECRITKARHVPHRLGRHHLLVDGKLPDSRKHARIQAEHPADVIRRVHVGRIEPGDHGIEARPLLRGQCENRLRHHGIHERVVVERGIRAEVVVGGAVARLEPVPLLLEGDPHECGAPHPLTQYPEKLR